MTDFKFDNPFQKSTKEYKRNINPYRQYMESSVFFLELMTGDPREQVVNFVKRKCKPVCGLTQRDSGIAPIPGQVIDPVITYLERQENGDREKKETTLLKYLAESVMSEELIAPTLTTYINPKVKMSLVSRYMDHNIAGRNKAKKEMFAAKMAKNHELAMFKNLEQNNKKIKNNSMSGAHASNGTPLHNKTAHATLTSNCRSTSGYGNANNEKLISGNRHYWNWNIVVNNIVSICQHTDYDNLREVVQKYSLTLPTVEETMAVIKWSTDLYWVDKDKTNKIRTVVEKLNPLQRAAFVYTGDLYHLRKLNDSFMRTLYDRLTLKVETDDNPEEAIKAMNDDVKTLSVMINKTEMMGVEWSKLKELPVYQKIAGTARNIMKTVMEYSDFIKVFFVTENVPASLAWFPTSQRRCVITSDTDSTIFTVSEWVKWHRGNTVFNDESSGSFAATVFFASQTVAHLLALMSSNFGISEENLNKIAMKNEFSFPVFVPTQVAKHYFASIDCQEGNMFDHLEREIKGVHLKASNVPKYVIKEGATIMEEIMDTVLRSEQIELSVLLKRVADLERDIYGYIKEGKVGLFKRVMIKNHDSYALEQDKSPYRHMLFWNEVWGPKYSMSPPAPFSAYKITTTLEKRKELFDWVDSIEDKELSSRLKAYLEKNNKKDMGTFVVPSSVIVSTGVPVELMGAINTRKMIKDICSVFYIVLETLGVYTLGDKTDKLISDFY